MMVNEKIKAAEENLIHVYNRFPIALERGEGVYLYDTNGKKYLDFAAGIAVFALGYGNQAYNDALKAQIDKLLHVHSIEFGDHRHGNRREVVLDVHAEDLIALFVYFRRILSRFALFIGRHRGVMLRDKSPCNAVVQRFVRIVDRHPGLPLFPIPSASCADKYLFVHTHRIAMLMLFVVRVNIVEHLCGYMAVRTP